MFFDDLSRPLARFYDLTLDRRAEMISLERVQVSLRRRRLKPKDFWRECALLDGCEDSVALLDISSGAKSARVYQNILLGEHHA